jgi:acyl-CoA dehydrogenase
VTVAKQILKDFRPDNDLFPSYHVPKVREAAREKHADLVEELKAEWAARAQSIDAL